MEKKTETKITGVSRTAILGVIFIALKVSGVVNWEWKWVLSPFWLPILIIILILLAWGVFTIVVNIYTAIDYKSHTGLDFCFAIIRNLLTYFSYVI